MQFNLDKNVRYGLAFSGGVDSCYLLTELVRQGYDVKAYTLRGAFQLGRDMRDADRVAEACGAEREVIEVDIWHGHDDILANPENRCYLCKRTVFGTVLEHMRADGRTVLLDGTNASDRPERRPGMRACAELGVVSPLRDAGLTKDMVREQSRKLGLPTADKPSYACYAVYHPAGERITPETLEHTAQAFWAEHGGERSQACEAPRPEL